MLKHGMLYVLTVGVVVLACDTSAPPEDSNATAPSAAASDESVLEALEQIDLEWEQAASRGDAAAIADLYTEDGALLPPNSEIVQGRANIERALQGFVDAGMTNVDFTRVSAGFSGDLAYEIGRYSLDLQPEGAESITDTGKYVIVARRGSDGTWRLVADIFNTSQPAQQRQ